MCGRYKRPGKQKIAEAFALSEGLETTFDLEPDDNACSQSFLPVIHLNENGDRQIELMRWACVTAQALHRHSLAPQFCRVLTPFWDTSSIATDKRAWRKLATHDALRTKDVQPSVCAVVTAVKAGPLGAVPNGVFLTSKFQD